MCYDAQLQHKYGKYTPWTQILHIENEVLDTIGYAAHFDVSVHHRLCDIASNTRYILLSKSVPLPFLSQNRINHGPCITVKMRFS